jgi:hypothetical protein
LFLERLKIVDEWIAILLQVWEVMSSNLSLETIYPDISFCGFPQFLQADAVTVP